MSTKIKLQDAIRDGDLERVQTLFNQYPKLITTYPATGTSWPDCAARTGNLEILKYMIDIGFDINQLGRFGEARPIDGAAVEGQTEAVRFLIEHGSILDTSDTTCNPLLRAIIGGSADTVRLLLDSGIDATVKYPHTHNTDATAFAFIRGHPELADIIASHIAKGDEQFKQSLLDAAQQNASLYGPLVPMRVLPDETDLDRN